jgi:protein-disulfide isomerase
MTRRLTASARFGLLIGAAIVLIPAGIRADEAKELPVQEVERIVRDYLMREPEVIYQALQELQQRQAAAAAERQRLAVLENRDALLNDANDPVAGDLQAEVTMVEFFDYRCTYCRRVVDSIQSLLEDETEVRIVFKDLPVLGEDSVRAARAALASRRQNGYLPFHFALMQANDLSEAGILKIAGNLGLDTGKLARDMNGPEIDQAIEANYALAERLGIEGTPAFVIGDQLVPGAIDEARMRSLIEAARSS